MTKEGRDKAKFRETSRWKNFRKKMKQTRKVDALTGKALLKGFQVHHCDLNPDNYKNLNAANFECLNRKSHEVVHWLYRYDWRQVLKNLESIMLKMEKLNSKEELKDVGKNQSIFPE